MKALLVLIPLMLLFAGCVAIDEESITYNSGVSKGEANVRAEVRVVENQLKLVQKENSSLEKELERKTEVTREALEIVNGFEGVMKENNEVLEELGKRVTNMDLNINGRIDDLNKSVYEGLSDLNVSINDINVS